MTHEAPGGSRTAAEARLTPAQARTLADVRAAGSRSYNGRKRPTIEALEAAGLVVVEWDVVPRADGKHTWRITVAPA